MGYHGAILGYLGPFLAIFGCFLAVFGAREHENRVRDEADINSDLFAAPDLEIFRKFHKIPKKLIMNG